jgi:hypothetical protein
MAWTQHDRAAEGEIPACVAGAIPARSFETASNPSESWRANETRSIAWIVSRAVTDCSATVDAKHGDCDSRRDGEDRRRGGNTLVR